MKTNFEECKKLWLEMIVANDSIPQKARESAERELQKLKQVIEDKSND